MQKSVEERLFMQRIPHCFRKRALSADLYRFKPRKKLVQQRLDLYQTLFVSFMPHILLSCSYQPKFDLLEELRKAAKKGRNIIRDAISESSSEDVVINNTVINTYSLEKLEELLIKTERVKTLNGVRKLLNEETIPLELVIVDQFWGNFQELIYKLSRDEPER